MTLINSHSPDLKIKSFGEYLFNNVIFFAPSAENLGGISFEDLVEFSNDGGNLIIAVNRDVSDSVRDFVEVLGISIHNKGFEVIDHFHFDLESDVRLESDADKYLLWLIYFLQLTSREHFDQKCCEICSNSWFVLDWRFEASFISWCWIDE